jgi:hypothetical protein
MARCTGKEGGIKKVKIIPKDDFEKLKQEWMPDQEEGKHHFRGLWGSIKDSMNGIGKTIDIDHEDVTDSKDEVKSLPPSSLS